MAEALKSFEELKCWQSARTLRIFVHELLKSFPADEKYTLINQMKRAARSVTNNIAEGFGRFHYQENIQYCRQARGSLYELIDHFIICIELQYINEEQYQQARALINESTAILNGYINYLAKAKLHPNNQ